MLSHAVGCAGVQGLGGTWSCIFLISALFSIQVLHLLSSVYTGGIHWFLPSYVYNCSLLCSDLFGMGCKLFDLQLELGFQRTWCCHLCLSGQFIVTNIRRLSWLTLSVDGLSPISVQRAPWLGLCWCLVSCSFLMALYCECG